MPEIALVWKIVSVLYGMVTFGVGWWVKGLNEKIKEINDRAIILSDKIGSQRERLAKLESESVTEAQVLRMLSEMERRIMDNFKEFRSEFNEDLKEFRENLREDLKDIKNDRRFQDRE